VPGTGKAATLDFLAGALRTAIVPCLIHFTVREWQRSADRVLDRIARQLGAARLAVRSSAGDEDGHAGSLAGHYRTRLDVPNRAAALHGAIEEVIASLPGRCDDRVVVQEMFAAHASGVMLSHDPDTGAPYYVIEYDEASSRPDRVTAGRVVPRVAVIHRGVRAERAPDRIARLLRVGQEVERLWPGVPLEIEFAQTAADDVAVLQARPLACVPGREARRTIERTVADGLAEVAEQVSEAERRRASLAGRRTILGQMPDWNPAELIGAKPAPLALSLFRYLVSDRVWREARATVGYRRLRGVPLVVALAGRPYVDVRASFNSFLPAELPERDAEPLVDAWIARLRQHPELHDRVEFEVAHTALDFSFQESFRARYGMLLPPSSMQLYAGALRDLTVRALRTDARGSLARALAKVGTLGSGRGGASCVACDSADGLLGRALEVLARCRLAGAMPFAIVARHAFVAEALLRSAVARGALDAARLGEFRRAQVTVASDVARDFAEALRDEARRPEFLQRYGHLRPGTFDVTSPRYDQRPQLFGDAALVRERPAPPRFELRHRERDDLDRLLRESGLCVSAAGFLHHASTAIIGRERAKFLLSRLLSDALEGMAAWAASRGLGRDELSFLTVDDLRECTTRRDPRLLRDVIVQRRARLERLGTLRLAPLIRDGADLILQMAQPPMPTFVTGQAVTAPPLRLDPRAHAGPDVAGRIACIESADPGFDWLFAYRPAGLVTEFGGGNSHMAIRCFELGVPAAIGVGRELFSRVSAAPYVELRCAERSVRPGCPVVSA